MMPWVDTCIIITDSVYDKPSHLYYRHTYHPHVLEILHVSVVASVQCDTGEQEDNDQLSVIQGSRRIMIS